jgi:ubiquinone/menaquinone biosynthesis C-methylase UbiE
VAGAGDEVDILREEIQSMCRIRGAMVGLSVGLVAISVAVAADATKSQGPAPYPASMNQKFTAPDVDIEQFVQRFENDSRDVYAKRESIVRAINLKPGDAVADIGAGTGLFTMLFADRVGKKGTVFAVDISPAFVKYIGERAKKRSFEHIVKTVRNEEDSVGLTPGSIDAAFLCDTYHHFEQPEKMLASIHKALRPDGRLVIVDFNLHKDASEFVKKRARAPKEVYIREIASAGFRLIDKKDAPSLADDFYAEFQRVDRK